MTKNTPAPPAKPEPELPELNAAFKAAEIAALKCDCTGECKITQAVLLPGNLKQLVTSCATCGQRKTTDCR